MTRTPHTYKRRTITLRPPVDDALARRANRLHSGNVSAAVAALVEEAEGVTSVSMSGNAEPRNSRLDITSGHVDNEPGRKEGDSTEVEV